MVHINACEVLIYLNELGYKNITSIQLKEFIKDLKKLLKYEEKQQQQAEKCRKDRELAELHDNNQKSPKCPSKDSQPKKLKNIVEIEIKKPECRCARCIIIPKDCFYRFQTQNQTTQSSSLNVQPCNQSVNKISKDTCSQTQQYQKVVKDKYTQNRTTYQLANYPDDVGFQCCLEHLNSQPLKYWQGDVSSKKRRPSKTCQKKRCPKCMGHRISKKCELWKTPINEIPDAINFDEDICKSRSPAGASVVPAQGANDSKSTAPSPRPTKTDTRSLSEVRSDCRTRALIKPRCGTGFKSDPVALYHFYKREWAKYKLPGEDNHSKLRWTVREKLLGGMPNDGNKLSCRRQTPVS